MKHQMKIVSAIDFSTKNKMMIKSKYFPHKNTHEETWQSPEGRTNKQICHVLVDRRLTSSISDARSCRDAA